MMNPSRQFIDQKLGGTDAVATRLGRKPSAVRMWAHRRAIPRSVWPELIEAYEGLTLDDLRAVEDAVRDAA